MNRLLDRLSSWQAILAISFIGLFSATTVRHCQRAYAAVSTTANVAPAPERLLVPQPPHLSAIYVQRHEDPFQHVARRALSGQYGRLRDWQKRGYEAGLRQGVTATTRLVLTQYNGDEPSGHVDGYGQPCDPGRGNPIRVAASNRIKRGSWIWTEATGLREVRDCGSHANDGRAARLHGIWVDSWFRHARDAREAGIDGWVPTIGAVIPQ